MHLRNRYCWFAFALIFVVPPHVSTAIEHVLVNRGRGFQEKLSGKILYEDPSGGMLLKTDEGGMWTIPSEKVANRSHDDQPLKLLDKDALGKRLQKELGPAFKVHHSTNYVVVYNTTRTYARWCSSLLERLQRAFIAFWRERGCEVQPPKTPMAVLIFNNKATYLQYAKTELGNTAERAIGYYSLQTNRIAMYDLTGMQALRRYYAVRGKKSDITALLSHEEAIPLVSTIVHEATHQISFNCGLQTRFVDNPAWLGEGLAVYFETPDLSSNRGWRGIGNVNYARWDLFRKNYAAGNVGRLPSLIATDERIRNSRTAVDAYAEAWAWNYFLITWHPKQFTAYLKDIAAKPLLVMDDKQTRLSDFQKHFGSDYEKLEAEFERRMSRLK